MYIAIDYTVVFFRFNLGVCSLGSVMGKEAGLEDIPGVLGPIEDPYQRERKRLYADPVVDFPVYEYKSKYNPFPLVQKLFFYAYEYPLDVAHKFFDKLSVTKPRRYYHQKFNRVPNIWECHTDDAICIYEAESQFRRDRKVDQEILDLIEKRVEMCQNRAGEVENAIAKCKDVVDLLHQVRYAWHVKYGELGLHCNARNALNKQKNRFIEDRYLARIGKIDSVEY